LYFGQTKGGIFNRMADYNAYLVPGVIGAYVSGMLQPFVTRTAALFCILAGPVLSILFDRVAMFGFNHDLQAFHRAGLVTLSCYFVIVIASRVTQHERDGEREQYTWGRFHSQKETADNIVPPWWFNDKLWAGLLVASTLWMCWYFR
jgi:hypothetical protein